MGKGNHEATTNIKSKNKKKNTKKKKKKKHNRLSQRSHKAFTDLSTGFHKALRSSCRGLTGLSLMRNRKPPYEKSQAL